MVRPWRAFAGAGERAHHRRPSKGRPGAGQAWLADCGLTWPGTAALRGYLASLKGSRRAGAPALRRRDRGALSAGEVHLGITGEDLLREQGEGLDGAFSCSAAGLAAPTWSTPELARRRGDGRPGRGGARLPRRGRRMRVATKYLAQTRAFFARYGVVDYRIRNGGATEGAPAAGSAELVVDITTTATLAANGLKCAGGWRDPEEPGPTGRASADWTGRPWRPSSGCCGSWRPGPRRYAALPPVCRAATPEAEAVRPGGGQGRSGRTAC